MIMRCRGIDGIDITGGWVDLEHKTTINILCDNISINKCFKEQIILILNAFLKTRVIGLYLLNI